MQAIGVYVRRSQGGSWLHYAERLEWSGLNDSLDGLQTLAKPEPLIDLIPMFHSVTGLHELVAGLYDLRELVAMAKQVIKFFHHVAFIGEHTIRHVDEACRFQSR